MAAVKRLPVHHHSADYVFSVFWIIGLILSPFENRVPLKPVLGGGGGGAVLHHYIKVHEQTQLKRSLPFSFLLRSLRPKDLLSELIRTSLKCLLKLMVVRIEDSLILKSDIFSR